MIANIFKSYLLLIRWQVLRLKTMLPFIVVIQVIIAVGTVYGLGYLYPAIDPLSAKYIVTGATTMTLITLGLVMIPQNVAQMKERKVFDYMWSLPIPRVIYLLVDFTIWTIIVSPGVVLALVMGSYKYGFGLNISPMAVLAFILVSLTAAAVGMSIAHLSPSPVLTGIITNVIIFSLFLFSPINFPVDRLPLFLSKIHMVLPVKYMADLVRGTLTTGLVENIIPALAAVGIWCVLSMVSLYVVFTRKR